ncbi:MAG: winged helix-turn-helix domain-containing protein, partial [Nocardioides sp.]
MALACRTSGLLTRANPALICQATPPTRRKEIALSTLSTLPVRLDRSAPGSLGVQLSGRIRELVVAGTLERGDRLPSSRALAADLGVSRSVPEQAYEQLLAEGWLEARRGAGTFVAATG